MHFQVIKDKYYEELIRGLKEEMIEFQSVFEEEDGIYLILGEFGRFIIRNINNERLLEKAFKFINHAVEAGGNKTEDAIVLQIFQPIYDDYLLVTKAKNFLSGKALQVFEKFRE